MIGEKALVFFESFHFDDSDTKFVFSKDSLCFQEVIDSFNNAESIAIVTYSLPMSKDSFLMNSILEATKNEIPVKIITNIPGRFEEYYTDRSKSTSKQKISKYVESLNPKKYGYLLTMYFNFNNHIKLIMTNEIAFIGSANFSEASGNNYESGIISRNPSFIRYLTNKVIPEIEKESVGYYDSIESKVLLDHIIDLFYVEDYIQRALTDISQTSFYITGTKYGVGKEFNDCKDSSEELRWKRLIHVSDMLEFFCDHLSDLNNNCFNYDEDIQEFKQFYDETTEFLCTKIANIGLRIEEGKKFDDYEFIMNLVEELEHSSNEYIENTSSLEVAQNIAYHESQNRMYGLRDDLIKLMDSIQEYIDAVSEGREQLGKFVSKYNTLNRRIDNTNLQKE
jgi:hypothetical protein